MDEVSGSITKHPICAGTRRDGQPCGAPALLGNHCFAHSPENAAARDQARRRGGQGKARTERAGKLVPSTLRPVLAALLEVLGEVQSGDLAPGQANAVANVAGAIVKVYTSGQLEDRLADLETQIATFSRRPA